MADGSSYRPHNIEDGDKKYARVVDILFNMFGPIVNRDAIITVVQSCEGDLTHSLEVMMKITETPSLNHVSDTLQPSQSNRSQQPTLVQPTMPQSTIPQPTTPQPTTPQPNTSIAQPFSYANMSRSTGAVPKTIIKPLEPKKIRHEGPEIWNDQIKRIIQYHNQGYRTLIIMRGLPGSGKSYLAKKIVEMTIGGGSFLNYRTHIFSTDDYFYQGGRYKYDVTQLSSAHEWNQQRVKVVSGQGLSPVIIDNTNVELWEMKSYVHAGMSNGYYIEIIEPKTPWAFNANQLAKKNSHNVPLPKIRRMLDSYQKHNSVDYLIKSFGFFYPAGKKPPLLRTIPDLNEAHNNQEIISATNTAPKADENIETIGNNTSKGNNVSDSIVDDLIDLKSPSPSEHDSEEERIKKIAAIQKEFDEFEKVDTEWEMGPQWNEHDTVIVNNPNTNQSKSNAIPKPQRFKRDGTQYNSNESLLSPNGQSWKDIADWRNLPYKLPDWGAVPSSNDNQDEMYTVPVTTSSTSIEVGDLDITSVTNKNRVLNTKPRDINLFYMPLLEKKIPHKIMIDKSTDTDDRKDYKCKNERHFKAFRKLFKHIAEAELRDIFDKCCGDVNWAVEIVLDGVANNEIETYTEILCNSDEEEHDCDGTCDCTEAYNIVPNLNPPIQDTANNNEVIVQPIRKAKKEKVLSESTLKFKREIEKNFVIGDQFYSEHCLKIRKFKHGEVTPVDYTNDLAEENAQALESGSDDGSSQDEPEETVNVTLGRDFINQLGDIFGKPEVTCPEHISPMVCVPKSLLQQLNAFWLESLTHQMEVQHEYSEMLLKEDEEFAKSLAEKEEELASQGREPEVPDFKEIMDMDFAQSLYDRDVAEWKNEEPDNMAARMTREKLYNLFPDVSQDTLSQILLAHDNNFQATVEVLLMSTGQTTILTEKNGVSKFVMEKEMARQEKALEEERAKGLSEEEWPNLTNQGQPVEMSTVDEYREQAQKQLKLRNLNLNKAQDYCRRGMTQVASYYSDVAAYHKKKFEQANSFAASSLIQVHTANHADTTLDLHFLFVAEAVQALDLFLDHHIKLLSTAPAGQRGNTLFFITGRGLHSRGGPRVKPAVRKRLKLRGLTVTSLNPGLLSVAINGENKLTHQIITE